MTLDGGRGATHIFSLSAQKRLQEDGDTENTMAACFISSIFQDQALGDAYLTNKKEMQRKKASKEGVTDTFQIRMTKMGPLPL